MIFIVVPAFNEERNIGRVVRGLFEQGYNSVVVVDDGSTDNTGAIAAQNGAYVIRHPVNRGQGAALQTGDEHVLSAGADMVVHFDADGQFNPADISPAITMMKEKKLDVVLGSRFLDKRSKVPAVKKYLILPVSRLINFIFTGVWLSDAHNGFRVLSWRAFQAIKITQDAMAHNSEIIAQIKEKKLKFAEFPVEVTYTRYGQGIGGGLKILWDLLFVKFFK